MTRLRQVRHMLRIKTLGRLSISRQGEEVEEFASRKVTALLVYLACTGREHPRDVLAELLWDDRSQRQAMANLRVALSSLRKVVASHVAITRTTAGILPESGLWLDTSQVEQALASIGEHELLTASLVETLKEAVALYEGDFLAGFCLTDATGFEIWAAGERQRLHRLTADALQRLGRWHLRQGNCAAAIAFATRLLEIDILAEAGHRQLIQALARNGQRAEAIAQYKRCQEILADELGIAPAARTKACYEMIRAGDYCLERRPLPGMRGFELVEQIGKGSYGTIYRAVQPGILREVAVKVIDPQYANDPQYVRRFEAEAQMVARLEHPYIVPLYECWRDPRGAYLVMRYMRGGNLLEALKTGPWNLERTSAMLEQIAGALASVHRQGIVHRDIKPANILLDESGNAYLADFGIARDLTGQRDLAAGGALVGTLDYVSPEQITGDAVTPQTDIYSLGAVLYHTLSGEKPFDGASAAELLYSHLHKSIPLVSAQRPDFPFEVDAVLQKATAKKPAERYASVEALAAAFRAAVRRTRPGRVFQAPVPLAASGDACHAAGESAPTKEGSRAPAAAGRHCSSCWSTGWGQSGTRRITVFSPSPVPAGAANQASPKPVPSPLWTRTRCAGSAILC